MSATTTVVKHPDGTTITTTTTAAAAVAGEAPALKLIYFDFPGAAEPIRMALEFAGLAYEDYRFKDRSELTKMKEDKALMFGQVPALQVSAASGSQSSKQVEVMKEQNRPGRHPSAGVVHPQGSPTSAVPAGRHALVSRSSGTQASP